MMAAHPFVDLFLLAVLCALLEGIHEIAHAIRGRKL